MHTHEDETILQLINKNDGTVLVLVLVVLVATIIVGVALMRDANTEAKIVVNERQYQQDFYDAVSAHEMAFVQSVSAVTSLGINEGSLYTYPVTDLPAGTNVDLGLKKIGKPPVGGGDGINLETRYYEMESTKGDHLITVGAYKSFPKM